MLCLALTEVKMFFKLVAVFDNWEPSHKNPNFHNQLERSKAAPYVRHGVSSLPQSSSWLSPPNTDADESQGPFLTALKFLPFPSGHTLVTESPSLLHLLAPERRRRCSCCLGQVPWPLRPPPQHRPQDPPRPRPEVAPVMTTTAFRR